MSTIVYEVVNPLVPNDAPHLFSVEDWQTIGQLKGSVSPFQEDWRVRISEFNHLSARGTVLLIVHVL